MSDPVVVRECMPRDRARTGVLLCFGLVVVVEDER